MRCDIKVEEVEYSRHGDPRLIARLYRPGGRAVPDHGRAARAAWCREDRLTDEAVHEMLANSGVIVASLDFRMPPVASYPGSMVDIHYGIRWLKSAARTPGSRPDMVGVMGTSSGGHQAMLTACVRATRATVRCRWRGATAADATVRCRDHVLARHRSRSAGIATRRRSRQAESRIRFADRRAAPGHDPYWQTEAAMEEGCPVTGARAR